MVANQSTKNKINCLATVVKGPLTTVTNQFTKNKINWLATVITVANQSTKNKINWLATVISQRSLINLQRPSTPFLNYDESISSIYLPKIT